MQITCTGGKRILRTSEEVLFAGLNSSEYQQLKIGEPKPEKNSGPRNSFLSTIPEVEKLAEFSGETIFKSEEKWRSIARKLGPRADPGRRKVLKRTIIPVIYNGCQISVADSAT